MPESFLHLKAQEQSQIYRALAPQLARSPVVLEKDVWVCWVLQALFTMPGRLPMAFKGGTSYCFAGFCTKRMFDFSISMSEPSQLSLSRL